MRTDVFYFSGSGNSRTVAVSVAEKLGAVPFDITEGLYSVSAAAETAAVVFPVYCQNVPPPVKIFLPTLRAERVALIATYGGISHGNVLNEAQKLISGTVVCGAYVPMGHSLLCDQIKFDVSEISSLLKQINSLEPAVFPHTRKNVFADFFPSLRSRIGIKLSKTTDCRECDLCSDACPMNAMENGVVKCDCIRCLRCVNACPRSALGFSVRPLTLHYLKRKRPTARVEIFP